MAITLGFRAAELRDACRQAEQAYTDTAQMYRDENMYAWAGKLSEVAEGFKRAATALEQANFGIAYECLHILCGSPHRDTIGDDADLTFKLASDALVLREKALALV